MQSNNSLYGICPACLRKSYVAVEIRWEMPYGTVGDYIGQDQTYAHDDVMRILLTCLWCRRESISWDWRFGVHGIGGFAHRIEPTAQAVEDFWGAAVLSQT